MAGSPNGGYPRAQSVLSRHSHMDLCKAKLRVLQPLKAQYREGADSVMTLLYGTYPKALDSLTRAHPPLDITPEVKMRFWHIGSGLMAPPGNNEQVCPKYMDHPLGDNWASFLSCLSPSEEYLKQRRIIAGHPQSYQLLEGPFSRIADKVNTELLDDIAVVNDNSLVVYIGMLWKESSQVNAIRVFFGSSCPLNRVIPLTHMPYQSPAEAALLGMRAAQLYLLGLNMFHLVVISGDEWTLGVMGGNFGHSYNFVGQGLQVPMIGWLSPHLRLMSEIQRDLNRVHWTTHYGRGAVLNHLYGGIYAQDHRGYALVLPATMQDPPEFHIQADYMVEGSPDPSCFFHLITHLSVTRALHVSHALHRLPNPQAQLQAGLTLRELSHQLGPSPLNELMVSKQGLLVMRVSTVPILEGTRYAGFVHLGLTVHSLDLDMVHDNEPNHLWASIATLTAAGGYANALGLKRIAVVMTEEDSFHHLNSFLKGVCLLDSSTPAIRAYNPSRRNRARFDDFFAVLEHVSITLHHDNGQGWGHSRFAASISNLCKRLGCATLDQLFHPPEFLGTMGAGTRLVRTGSLLATKDGNGVVEEEHKVLHQQHHFYYRAGNRLMPDAMHTRMV